MELNYILDLFASSFSFLYLVLRTSPSRPRQRGMHDHFTFTSTWNSTTFTKAHCTSAGEYLFCLYFTLQFDVVMCILQTYFLVFTFVSKYSNFLTYFTLVSKYYNHLCWELIFFFLQVIWYTSLLSSCFQFRMECFLKKLNERSHLTFIAVGGLS